MKSEEKPKSLRESDKEWHKELAEIIPLIGYCSISVKGMNLLAPSQTLTLTQGDISYIFFPMKPYCLIVRIGKDNDMNYACTHCCSNLCVGVNLVQEFSEYYHGRDQVLNLLSHSLRQLREQTLLCPIPPTDVYIDHDRLLYTAKIMFVYHNPLSEIALKINIRDYIRQNELEKDFFYQLYLLSNEEDFDYQIFRNNLHEDDFFCNTELTTEEFKEVVKTTFFKVVIKPYLDILWLEGQN